MCTVSFVPRANGFYLAMNRDEAVSRVEALPPRVFRRAGGVHCLYPHEPTGGTWIGANDGGVCLALINWHAIAREPAGVPVTRGEVIRALVGKRTLAEVGATLRRLPLTQMRPFRLIGVAMRDRAVVEWQWHLANLDVRSRPWTLRHWFSSGLDEAEAERQRGDTCRQAAVEKAAGTLGWLRRLHRTHHPARGPYDVCLHRLDAHTVSYTEVVVSLPVELTMRYQPGAPCQGGRAICKRLLLRDAPLPARRSNLSLITDSFRG
ncbi:MAG: NRDE family protein [Verrucomicrobia bacterium]|nr:NRDE family protein [Verrucomicrobiota bacterium]